MLCLHVHLIHNRKRLSDIAREWTNYTHDVKNWDQLITTDADGLKNGSLWIMKVEALKNGLLVVTAADNVIRVLPPLNTNKN